MNLKFLSNAYPIEESFFIISRFCLGWMGQYPQKTTSIFRTLNSLFHIIILFTGVVAQFWYGFYYLKVDIQNGVDAICPAISCAVSFVKMIFIIWYGKDLSFVAKHLQKLIFAEKDEEKKEILRHFSATATKLAFMVISSGVTANIVYSLRPLITNFYRVMIGKDYLFDETPLRVMLPTKALRLPWYPFSYTYVFYVGHVTVFAFSGVDSFFISFCLYLSALLKMLQKDIKSTLDQYTDNTYPSKEQNQKCCEQLAKIVDRHNEVIDLVNNFTRLFTLIILVHFVTSAVVIGASIIECLLFPGLRVLVYASYTAAVSCELYIYCYGGTSVSGNSGELGMTAYFSDWYNCNTEVKKMILMILIRSQKPLTMNVPFFSPSMETFMSIIRTAGSIIAVVNSVL